jgi:alginate O-acetyltransferase complex protein AlgI
MVFSSLTFMYAFLPIVLITYFLSPKKLKNIIILISGLIFYAWGEPKYIMIMITSAFVDYFAGLIISKSDDNKVRKSALLVSMVIDLGFLFIFKYSGFAVSIVNGVFKSEIPVPNLLLPIGISFYTFQSMSYTIDIYFKQVKVQRNFLNYLCYVSLFPQLVAGPIVRYEDVQNEIDERKININLVGEGVNYFVRGLAKKVLLANNIGSLWSSIKVVDVSEITVLTAWLGILSFTFQIYFDFSGYSDMAIGLGKMLGFNFPQNFNLPYLSKSISEFWRRWHMTLGAWFRSYVYIPLGGNREGKYKTIRNLIIVWFLTGLWHGASWNFIFWGMFYGFFIIIERLFLSRILEKIPSIFRMIYTFLLVVIGWVFFDLNTMSDSFKYLKAMFANSNGLFDLDSVYYFKSYIVVFIVCIIVSTNVLSKFLGNSNIIKKYYKYSVPIYESVLLILSTAYLVDSTYNPFLYFRF